MIYH
jgi:twinkle protein